jgi:hypothetical protein
MQQGWIELYMKEPDLYPLIIRIIVVYCTNRQCCLVINSLNTMHPIPVKVIPSPFNITSRKEFVEDLPKKVRNTVRGVDLVLINEAISAISEGHATINGKAPNTRAERYIVIASYFKTARNNLNMFFEGAENIENTYTVAIKYKDQPYTYNFPENIAD